MEKFTQLTGVAAPLPIVLPFWRARITVRPIPSVSADRGEVRVRDSADPAGAMLEVSRDSWQEFLARIKEGHFGDA